MKASILEQGGIGTRRRRSTRRNVDGDDDNDNGRVHTALDSITTRSKQMRAPGCVLQATRKVRTVCSNERVCADRLLSHSNRKF